MRIAALTTLLVCFALFSGCGGSDGGESARSVKSASEHLDQAEGDYLLAEAEYHQAYFWNADSPEAASSEPPGRAKRTEVRGVRRLLKKCVEGDGLESCTQVEAIRAIAAELNEALGGSG